ncbi:potassium channel family protein [Streptomyces sp. SL13]|jgi:voltage-gated potassium channel|uniref:Potassium channel family protein n=1 Tax=Streptantibioticus silvisoli TaxID=2705255 RepID=A0AA90H715_9ACTN|nr:potassium channel family protein [Streptantibioticus silvisoli]MDI5964657.1 potassium channel family protein [Streptantibioticus silvisoli]MDI5972130.1 potassium channel family protein [Streptantibioticus silvisoli]
MDSDPRVRAWERRTAMPLLTLSALYLGAYAVLVLATGVPRDVRLAVLAVLLAAWALFAADYLTRLALSRDRPAFARSRWLDLVVLALPLLRPLRVVQTYARARERRGGPPRLTLEAQVIVYTGLTTVLLGFAASLAVYQVEHAAPGATIRSYGDAVWWACSTLTAVGYGDVFPVTTRGRVIGVAVMLTGLGLLGAVMGTFSSWLVNRFRQATGPVPDEDRPPPS